MRVSEGLDLVKAALNSSSQSDSARQTALECLVDYMPKEAMDYASFYAGPGVDNRTRATAMDVLVRLAQASNDPKDKERAFTRLTDMLNIRENRARMSAGEALVKLGDARAIEPGPDLPPGTVAYMDPPYVGTSGYGHDLPRADVVALARRWADAGATVAISEAEPIGDLVSDGWYVVEVTEQRKGQKRTFSKQQREFLTMNRKPVEAVGPVMDLFGE